MSSRTNRALTDITDEGLFETLAASVLRLEPLYANLAHPGLNADGKTRKSPLDGICYTRDGKHIIATHHTVTAEKSLRAKWLQDPTTVKRRRNSKSQVETGDVVKAAKIFENERSRSSNLEATLVLTSNREIDPDLYSDVMAIARTGNFNVDIWSRTRIANVLDFDPRGQRIRRILGIEETDLSRELILEICAEIVNSFNAGDDRDLRNGRALDGQLDRIEAPVTLLVAGSGSGKTVACHQFLLRQILAGRPAIILPHEVLQQSLSLEQALFGLLKDKRPNLAIGQSVLSFFNEEDPIVVLVEDISRSGNAVRLIEKISSWIPEKRTQDSSLPARLLIPVWPHLLAGLQLQRKREIEGWVLTPEPITDEEAAQFACTFASRAGVQLSITEGAALARSLGKDPLFLGLNTDWKKPKPQQLIDSWAENVLCRIGQSSGLFNSDLREVLHLLAERMLARNCLHLKWNAVRKWDFTEPELASLRALLADQEIIRLEGRSDDLSLRFRHDRVRDWLLAEAARRLHNGGELPDHVLAEPALAEVVSNLVVPADTSEEFLRRVTTLAPLALFFAIRSASISEQDCSRLAELAEEWLAANGDRNTENLRWEAIIAVRDVTASFMPSLLAHFPDKWIPTLVARLANGDLSAGISLCKTREIRDVTYWTQHALQTRKAVQSDTHNQTLVELLSKIDPTTPKEHKEGILCFAGVWADPAIAASIQKVWDRDLKRGDSLRDYLWAFIRCATPETSSALLAPVCAAWAALPEAKDNGFDPRSKSSLAAHAIKDTFAYFPPTNTMAYFRERAKEDDLAWQIEYMLSSSDHPEMVIFEAECMARRRRISRDNYIYNRPAVDHWGRDIPGWEQVMSDVSRVALLAVWTDTTKDNYLREAAFDLWAANNRHGDLAELRRFDQDSLLSDKVFTARVRRHDRDVIPALIQKIESNTSWSLWHYTQYLWSPDLTVLLEKALDNLSKSEDREGEKFDVGRQLSHAIMRLPAAEAERVLLAYWQDLGSTVGFVEAALFIATPALQERVSTSVSSSSNPARFFKYLVMHTAWVKGQRSYRRQEQILALKPYLAHFERQDHESLRNICNENGWLELRREVLDPLETCDIRESDQYIEEALNDGVSRLHGHISHELDRIFEAGATWGQFRSSMERWLPKQKSELALELVANALRHSGSRTDIDLFDLWGGANTQLKLAVKEDTLFTLCRNRN